MSYCRFSSDNFKSDVYCWEDCGGGFRTEVAIYHITGHCPAIPNLSKVSKEKFISAMRRRDKFMKDVKRVEIGLEFDGQGFHDPTRRELLDRLILLRKTGYHVPQFAFNCLREEIKNGES